MKETRKAAWDCKFYKDDSTCNALIKMICKEKDCKFYKSITLNDVKKGEKND